jgi:hypothetical protein
MASTILPLEILEGRKFGQLAENDIRMLIIGKLP